MKCLLQRVSEAKVEIQQDDGSKRINGQIGQGLLLLVGFEQGDDASKLSYHVDKLVKLRIFADDAGKMNRSIVDVDGSFLVVSQFTLAGDCSKGTRPSFDKALAPTEAKALYELFIEELRALSQRPVETGEFGAMMSVSLVNDGPVTFWLEK